MLRAVYGVLSALLPFSRYEGCAAARSSSAGQTGCTADRPLHPNRAAVMFYKCKGEAAVRVRAPWSHRKHDHYRCKVWKGIHCLSVALRTSDQSPRSRTQITAHQSRTSTHRPSITNHQSRLTDQPIKPFNQSTRSIIQPVQPINRYPFPPSAVRRRGGCG
jgi:hypothetical protein